MLLFSDIQAHWTRAAYLVLVPNPRGRRSFTVHSSFTVPEHPCHTCAIRQSAPQHSSPAHVRTMASLCISSPETKGDDTYPMAAPMDESQDAQISKLHKTVKALTAAVAALCALVLAIIIAMIVGWILSVQHDDADSATAGLTASPNDIPKGSVTSGSLFAGSGTWVTKASMPNATSDLAVVATDTTAYLIGGYVTKDNGTALVAEPVAATWLYNSQVDSFTQGPDLPMPSARGAAAANDDDTELFYVAGRVTAGDDGVLSPGDCLFRLALLGGSNAWTSHPCMSTPRSDHCAVFRSGKLYVMGGYDAEYNILDSIEVFDVASGAWSTSALRLPSGRGDLMCVAVGDDVHVVGGVVTFGTDVGGVEQYETGDGPFTKEHVVVNVAKGTVDVRAPALYARGDAALVSVPSTYGTTLMYVGGETYVRTPDLQDSKIATHHVSEYYAATDTWVRKAPMLDARFRLAAASVERSSGDVVVVAFGGHNLCYESKGDVCNEIKAVEAYVDVDHPQIFVTVKDET